jgi:hypothetical protein
MAVWAFLVATSTAKVLAAGALIVAASWGLVSAV